MGSAEGPLAAGWPWSILSAPQRVSCGVRAGVLAPLPVPVHPGGGGGGAEAEPSWKLGGCRLGFQGPASVLRLLPGLPAVSPGLWALLGAGWGGARWLLLKDLLSP